ncbi:MAG: Tryptophan-rich protein TspO [Chlamydiae bacterium]|nr:Tryptophan-rich protein TspO [Chlamydiota bacterium]
MPKQSNGILSLILWYLPVLVIQLISSKMTITSLNPWYANLKKAPWNPPSWLFAPVWIILYIMMTVAIWLIYRSKISHSEKVISYSLFFSQLLFNGFWSFLFFRLHRTGWALIDLGALAIIVVLTTIYFLKVHTPAGILFIPYAIWVIYALTLNIFIYYLNR